MPNTPGTFLGLGARIGSTDSSGTTQAILGLYADNGGVPGLNLFYTSYMDAATRINNPSTPVSVSTSAGGYYNGFTGVLTAGATYWVYLKVTANICCPEHPTGGLSNSPCIGGSWINVDAPGDWSYTQHPPTVYSCPGNLAAWLIAQF